MGWSGGCYKTPEDARMDALGANTGWNKVIAKSGTWYIVEPGERVETPSFKVSLVTVLTKGNRGEYYTKVVDSCSGPMKIPAKSFLEKYKKIATERGQELGYMYENEFFARCEAHYAAKVGAYSL